MLSVSLYRCIFQILDTSKISFFFDTDGNERPSVLQIQVKFARQMMRNCTGYGFLNLIDLPSAFGKISAVAACSC